MLEPGPAPSQDRRARRRWLWRVSVQTWLIIEFMAMSIGIVPFVCGAPLWLGILVASVAAVAALACFVLYLRSRREVEQAGRLVCLVCRYPLVGLPARGPCPECGVAYTRSDVLKKWAEIYGLRVSSDR